MTHPDFFKKSSQEIADAKKKLDSIEDELLKPSRLGILEESRQNFL